MTIDTPKATCTLIIELDGDGIQYLSPGQIAREVTELIGNASTSSSNAMGRYSITLTRVHSVKEKK